MCTVTWTRQDDGYVLFCNRDERNTRLEAIGPQQGELRRVTYLAPIDGDFGGSWIGVNHFGLTLCLLNRYGDSSLDESREYISRGLLLTDLLDSRDTSDVARRINDFDFNQFRPLNLLALTPEPAALVVAWTGADLTTNHNASDLLPLTSTSLSEPVIASERTAQFQKLVSGGEPTPGMLDQFHRSHLPMRGPISVCMHREGARTVSLSRVEVTHREISFEYEDGSPCEKHSPQRLHLKRRNPNTF